MSPDGAAGSRTRDSVAVVSRVGESLGGRARPLPGGGYAIPAGHDEVGFWLSPDGGSRTYITP